MRIIRSDDFARQVKRLLRKYPLLLEDIGDLLEALENGERPGYLLRGVQGLPVRWTRLRNTSAGRGKSGGFRVVYYTGDSVILLVTIAERARVDHLQPRDVLGILRDAGIEE